MKLAPRAPRAAILQDILIWLVRLIGYRHPKRLQCGRIVVRDQAEPDRYSDVGPIALRSFDVVPRVANNDQPFEKNREGHHEQ